MGGEHTQPGTAPQSPAGTRVFTEAPGDIPSVTAVSCSEWYPAAPVKSRGSWLRWPVGLMLEGCTGLKPREKEFLNSSSPPGAQQEAGVQGGACSFRDRGVWAHHHSCSPRGRLLMKHVQGLLQSFLETSHRVCRLCALPLP